MFRRLLLVLGTASSLAGCGGDGGPSVTSVVPVSYTITEAAAGPVTADTPYSAAAFRQLFPNERIDVIATADEDGIVNALTVFSDGLQVMMVIPDRGGKSIKAVHGSGLAVAGPNGERLGMTFKEVRMDRSACHVGTGAWLGMAVCTAARTPNVRLVFDNGGWDGPSNQLAPSANLAEGRLQRIVWIPERSA
jgi:Protein of unknown function (DUF1131)